MSDFCKQCSEELFGKDFGDFKGLITPEEVREGKGAVVLCEDCVTCMVDHEGRCIAACEKNHGTQLVADENEDEDEDEEKENENENENEDDK